MVRLPAWVHQNAQNHVRSGGHHAHFEVDARSLLGGRSLFFFPRKNFEVVAAWSFSPGKHFEVVAGLTQPFTSFGLSASLPHVLRNSGAFSRPGLEKEGPSFFSRWRQRAVTSGRLNLFLATSDEQPSAEQPCAAVASAPGAARAA